MRFSVTFLKPWDSTTREYTAGTSCKNWKPPLVSVTASSLAFVATLVSVNLAPDTTEPLGSFTNPTMLPVGEAETVAAIRRTINATAHVPNCSLRYVLLDSLETRLRSINTSTPSHVFLGLCTAGLSATEFTVNVQPDAGICQGSHASFYKQMICWSVVRAFSDPPSPRSWPVVYLVSLQRRYAPRELDPPETWST